MHENIWERFFFWFVCYFNGKGSHGGNARCDVLAKGNRRKLRLGKWMNFRSINMLYYSEPLCESRIRHHTHTKRIHLRFNCIWLLGGVQWPVYIDTQFTLTIFQFIINFSVVVLLSSCNINRSHTFDSMILFNCQLNGGKENRNYKHTHISGEQLLSYYTFSGLIGQSRVLCEKCGKPNHSKSI